MSKTTKIILIASGILLIVIAGYFLITRTKIQPIPVKTGSGPETPGFTIPPEGDSKMTVLVKDGESFEINNVYKNPVTKLSYNGVVFKENSDYAMAFFPENGGSFIISIQSSDLNPAREKAETDFLQTLETTKDRACKLNVSLSTTFDISRKNAGREFGLSFCPGSKPFE